LFRRGEMKKLLLVGLILLALIGCQLFENNPFVGAWDANLAGLGFDPGDYCTITFDDNTFVEQGRMFSVSYSASGTYDYTDTVLMITYRGYATEYISYVIYDDTMVWEGVLYFNRK